MPKQKYINIYRIYYAKRMNNIYGGWALRAPHEPFAYKMGKMKQHIWHGMKPDDDSMKMIASELFAVYLSTLHPLRLQIHRFVKSISRRLNYLRVAKAGGRQAGRPQVEKCRTYTFDARALGSIQLNKYLSHLVMCIFFRVDFSTQTAEGKGSVENRKNHMNSYTCEWSVCSLGSITFIRLKAISSSAKCETKIIMRKSLNISSSIFPIETEGSTSTWALCIPVQFDTVQLARTIYSFRK